MVPGEVLLDHLERGEAARRGAGQVDLAHTARAEARQETVGSDVAWVGWGERMHGSGFLAFVAGVYLE
ncbi:hypothetical protein GCM10028793_43680 [Nocardiopsis oceani]